MKQFKFICFFVLVFFVMSSICLAHGLAQFPKMPAETQAPDAAYITIQLFEHHRYLFSEEQLTRLDKIHHSLQNALRKIRESSDEKNKISARKELAKGSQELINFLDNYQNLIDVEITEPGKLKMDLKRVIPVKGDASAVLYRIRCGDGATKFSMGEWDFMRHWEDRHENYIPFNRPGITYSLVDYKSIVPGTNGVTIYFAPIDKPAEFSRGLLSFAAPETGVLDFNLIDENKKNSPAMIRLVTKLNNRVRIPGSAIDFSDQFEKGGAPPVCFYRTDMRNVQLNGPLFGKEFHCIPGSFVMGLPPGEYDVTVYTGIEYLPVHKKFTIKPGKTTRVSVQMKRWVNMAGRGWYSGDDHVHARLMNDKDAGNILTFSKATDTHIVSVLCMGNHRRIWFPQRGYGPEFRVIDDDFVLVPGQECPRFFMGHSIGLNLKKLVRDSKKNILNSWVADTIHADGGLYGQAHLSHKSYWIIRDLTMQMILGKSDFGEILQLNHLGTELYYQFLNLGFKLTAAAGSDAPYAGSIGDVRIYAYIGKNKKVTADNWFEAMRRGRTFVSNGTMLDLHVNNAIPGDEIIIDKKQKVHISAKAWGLKNASAPKKLIIFSHGKIVKEIISDTLTNEELNIDFDFDVEFGTWIAACAFGHDGSKAHTTPVYITRKGFRFWDIEQASNLISKCYETLDEMEQSLANNKQWKASGTLDPLDHFATAIADQADLLIEPLKEVRAKYKKLEETYQKELKLRKKYETKL